MQSPFIKKLHDILQNQDHSQAIGWTSNSTVIEIRDEGNFQNYVLPKYFRHAKMASFIRQLNLYGFKKLRSAKKQAYTHPHLQSGKSFKEIVCIKKMRNLVTENQEVLERPNGNSIELRRSSLQGEDVGNRNSQGFAIANESGRGQENGQIQVSPFEGGNCWWFNGNMQQVGQNNGGYYAYFIF